MKWLWIAAASAVLIAGAAGAYLATTFLGASHRQAEPRNWNFDELAYSAEPTSDDFRAEAFRVGEEIVARYPSSTESLAVLARLQYSLGHSEAARELWSRAVEADPTFGNAHYALGVIAQDGADWETAEQHYRTAMSLVPADPYTPPRLAEVLMKSQRFEEAIQVLRAHFEQHAADAKAVLNLGHCYLLTDQVEAAAQTFEVMARQYPDSSSALSAAYYSLAAAYRRLGDSGRAAECQKKFVAYRPSDPDVVEDTRGYQDTKWMRDLLVKTLSEAGRAYRQLGNVEAAEEAFARCAAIDDHEVGSRLALLEIYGEQSRPADGVLVARELTQAQPENANHWLNLGLLSARVNDFATARQAITRAMKLDPHNPACQQAHALIVGGSGTHSRPGQPAAP